MLTRKNKGFSLIEVMIVLAISAGLIIIAFSAFSQRRRVASDDAAEQLVSSIQTVRNEAQNGLGPRGDTSNFAHDETFYGEAIRFSNNAADCPNSTPCMIVNKLKANANGTSFSSYEQYRVENTAGLEYFVPTAALTSCTLFTYQSCFTSGGTSVAVNDLDYAVIIKNGSGAMFYYPFVSGNCLTSGCSTSTVNKQGSLRQGLISRQGGSGDFEYYLNIDMSGGGSIGTTRP